MAIFEIDNLTAEQYAQETVNECKRRVNAVVRQYVLSYKREFDAFWRNPNCTPQQMAAAWGIEASALFTKSAITKNYLLALDPECLSEDYTNPPESVVFNADGTVTIGG